ALHRDGDYRLPGDRERQKWLLPHCWARRWQMSSSHQRPRLFARYDRIAGARPAVPSVCRPVRTDAIGRQQVWPSRYLRPSELRQEGALLSDFSKDRNGEGSRITGRRDEPDRSLDAVQIRLAYAMRQKLFAALAMGLGTAQSADIKAIRGQCLLENAKLPIMIVEKENRCRPAVDRQRPVLFGAGQGERWNAQGCQDSQAFGGRAGNMQIESRRMGGSRRRLEFLATADQKRSGSRGEAAHKSAVMP